MQLFKVFVVIHSDSCLIWYINTIYIYLAENNRVGGVINLFLTFTIKCDELTFISGSRSDKMQRAFIFSSLVPVTPVNMHLFDYNFTVRPNTAGFILGLRCSCVETSRHDLLEGNCTNKVSSIVAPLTGRTA
jgi:hypothetical protein